MTKVITHGKTFLLWCAHDFLNFRIQELTAITSLFNIKFDWFEEPSVKNPYFLVNLANASDVIKIMSRSVLIRSAYELWAYSNTLDGLHTQLKSLPKKISEAYCEGNTSFRVLVESFGKKLSREIKITRIDELAFMPFNGRIQLNDPDYSFLLMEYYGSDRNFIPEKPYYLFFGRWLCDGQRHRIQEINLKTRKFIGNTTMDPLLSLLMVNMARIKPGDLVLDPFVGSGGLLVAAAQFGGYVLGTDIDFLMLHGRAKPTRYNQKRREPDESIKANMKQYNLESNYLDVLVADASLPLWRLPSIFDAIITDPPYGIREPTERIGTEKDYKIPEHLAAGHIPSKVSYNLREIIEDLLDFSAEYLKLNGRLVYWMPLYKEDFDKNHLPHHPCLELVSYCEQGLTHHSSRFLITMEKVKECVGLMNKATVSEATMSFRHKYFQMRKEKERSQQS